MEERGIIPVIFVPSREVTGIVIFAEPLKLVAVPIAAPERAIVLAVANFVAEPALPLTEV